MLWHVLQSGLGYLKCLLVFQCPVSNTWKSNCQVVCMCMCVCMYALSLHASWQHRPCPHTPPSAIYVFAQPCDLTLSQATSTLGHVTRQAEICPLPRIPRSCTHTHTDTPLPSSPIIHIWPPLKQGSFLHRCKEKSHQQIPPHSSLRTTFFQPGSNIYEGCKRRNFRLSSAIPQF